MKQQVNGNLKPFFKRLALLPVVMALGVGMSLRQAVAVLGALRPAASAWRPCARWEPRRPSAWIAFPA